MSTFQIAVAGCGLIGREHVKRILENPVTKLSAIIDPSDEARSIAADSECEYYASLDQLFENQSPSGVIIATPNHLHVKNTILCLESQTPVLVEKPLADNWKEAAQLCDLIDKYQGKVLVGHHRAHSPIVNTAAKLIKDGLLGDLVAIQGSATFYKPDDYFDQGPWRKVQGGGPILINLIHEIGNLRQMCGEITAVQAISSNSTRKFEVEDTATISLIFKNGALGSFLLSDTAASARSWEQTSKENPSYSSYEDEDCYVISGTYGTLSIPTMRLKKFCAKEDRSWWKELKCSTIELTREDPLILQLQHFCAVMAGEAEPLVSAYDGLQNMKVIDAIQRSISSRGTVQIE
jgi:predicted dehydrogenase